MATVYIGLGSNLGDREALLNRAVDLLSRKIQILAVSSIYESDPLGFTQQPPFLNAVAKADTSLSPRELLDFTQSVERELGRKRIQLWGPRTVDLDILLYDSLDLTIPHPRLHERAFVLVTLGEIDPLLQHPVLEESVCALLNENCAGQSIRMFGSLKKYTGGQKHVLCEKQ